MAVYLIKTKMDMKQKVVVHPMIVFWLGVLTGALLLGVIFLDRMMNMVEYQSAIYKAPKIQQQQIDPSKLNTPILPSPKSGLPQIKGIDPYSSSDPIPTP